MLKLKEYTNQEPSVIANHLDREVQLGGIHSHVVSPPGVHLSPRGYSQSKK